MVSGVQLPRVRLDWSSDGGIDSKCRLLVDFWRLFRSDFADLLSNLWIDIRIFKGWDLAGIYFMAE